MQPSITGIQKEDIHYLWSFVEPLIKSAVDRNIDGTTTDDVLGLLLDGLNQLWVIYDGKDLSVAITAIDKGPRKNICRLLYVAGRNVDAYYKQFIDVLERWAIENGCTIIAAPGRKGWEKFAKQIGFRHSYSMFTKEIGN